MTEIMLPEAKAPVAGRDVPLQEVSDSPSAESPQRIFTAYFDVICIGEPKPYKGYRTHLQYDPKKWDYPPEEDCAREWAEPED